MEEAKVVCVITPVGNEMVGLIRGQIQTIIILHNPCLIMRQQNKLVAKTFSSMPEYRTNEIHMNTSGCAILELGANSQLFDLWTRANSQIITSTGPQIKLARAN